MRKIVGLERNGIIGFVSLEVLDFYECENDYGYYGSLGSFCDFII